jgi:hypothetical protein
MDRVHHRLAAAAGATWAAVAVVAAAAAVGEAAAEEATGLAMAAQAVAAEQRGSKGDRESSRGRGGNHKTWPRASAAVWAAMAAAVPVTAKAKAAPAAEAGTGAQYNISREGGKAFNRNRVHHQRAAAACATWAAAEAGAAKTWAEFTMIAEALAGPSPATGTFTRQLGQHCLTCTETTANRQIFEKMLGQHDLMSTETTVNRHNFKRQQLHSGRSIACYTAESICRPRKPCTTRQPTNQAASGALWHTILPQDTCCPHPTHTPHTPPNNTQPPQMTHSCCLNL